MSRPIRHDAPVPDRGARQTRDTRDTRRRAGARAPLALTLLAQVATLASAATMDPTPFLREVDRNRDGCVTQAEWRRAGAPQSAYDMLKDAAGCVTAAAMARTEAPDEIGRAHV